MACDQQESPLIPVFKNHEFDVVGLARMPNDDAAFRRSLCVLRSILIKDYGVPLRKKVDRLDERSLAHVLFAIIAAALRPLGDGRREFWSDLSDRIRMAADFSNDLADSAYSQKLLGESFHRALKCFGYRIPEEGQKPYVGTAVYHAGIPRPAVRTVLELVDAAHEEYREHVIALNPTERRPFIEKANPHLEANTLRLLGSDTSGAGELWKRLASVILARRSGGNLERELQQLPIPAFDVDQVRQLLEQHFRQRSLF